MCASSDSAEVCARCLCKTSAQRPNPRTRVAFHVQRAPLLNMNENNADTGERNHTTTTTVLGPLLLTALQAAQLLAVGRTSVYELIATGDLATVHIGRSMRIPADSVRAFVELRRRRP